MRIVANSDNDVVVMDRFYVQFSNGTKTGWMKLGQDDVENPSGYFYGVTARLAG